MPPADRQTNDSIERNLHLGGGNYHISLENGSKYFVTTENAGSSYFTVVYL